MADTTPHQTGDDYSLSVLSEREWGRIIAAERGLDFPEETASVVERIVRERMAQAWDEGKHSDHTVECRFGDGDCICENPYRVFPARTKIEASR